MIQKVRMKRHESFSLREGWLAKGLNEVKKNKKVFSSSDATDELGVGYNMVKSLKYWMYATKLIEDVGRDVELTEFGNLILKYDSYLEDKFTWWLIHLQIVLNSVVDYKLNNNISAKLSNDYIYNLILDGVNNTNTLSEELKMKVINKAYEYKQDISNYVYDIEVNLIEGVKSEVNV